MDGEQDWLGWWLSASEGATCWLSVFTAWHNRGVQDGFMAGVDGRNGLPEAIAAVLPTTQGPLCIGPQVRHRLT
jgi:transposase-like protein